MQIVAQSNSRNNPKRIEARRSEYDDRRGPAESILQETKSDYRLESWETQLLRQRKVRQLDPTPAPFWSVNMRVNEGIYAYEVLRNRDPETQLPKSWDFVIYVLHPVEKVVERGSCSTLEEAEKQASRRMSNLAKKQSVV